MKPAVDSSEVSLPNIFSNPHSASLTTDRPDLSKIVKTWYQCYKRSQLPALQELLEFALRSSGMPEGSVTVEQLEGEAGKDILGRLEELAGAIQTYPLMSGGQKAYKNFFVDFQYFWVHLVGEGSEYLYDGVALTFIFNWLSSLSHSKFRPLRHTATAALFATGQALTDVLSHENRNYQRLQDFIEAEPGSSRTTRLRNQQEEIKEKIRTLRVVIDSLVEDVLSCRCKDVMIEIRSLSAQYLGTLMSQCPANYITDKTIGFLSLLLYDKSGDVRKHVLDYLHRLYTNGAETCTFLTPFTTKQLPRLVEMCHDIEPRCCVRAIKICTELLKQGNMSIEYRDMVSYLLWTQDEEVRDEAAEFVAGWLFQGSEVGSVPGNTLDRGRKMDAEAVLLALVHFYQTYGCGLSFRIKLMLQGFWERNDSLKRWEVYFDLFLRAGRENATGLNTQDALILMQMLKSSLEILRETDKPASKSLYSDLSGLIFERAVQIFPLCDSIPLLNTFVEVIKELDLSPIAFKDMRGSVVMLVDDVRLLFLRHKERKLLENMARALDHLCNHPHPLQKEAKEILLKTVDEATESLKDQLRLYLEDDQDEGYLEITVARVAALISVHDLVDEIDEIEVGNVFTLLTHARTGVLKSKEHACSVLKVVFFYHLWKLNRLITHPEDLTLYLEIRNKTIEELAGIVQSSSVDQSVRDEAFTLLCETLMISASQATEGQPVYFYIEGQLVKVLCDFTSEIQVKQEIPEHLIPPKAFDKKAIKCEIPADADERSVNLIFSLSRIICNCPSITLSQLPSLYIALFGASQLKSVYSQVKQVVSHLRNKDATQTPPFHDKQVYFSILLDSLIRSAEGHHLPSLKELSKRLSSLQGLGSFKPRQASALTNMLIEGTRFALASIDNVFFLDAMTAFLTKNFLTPKSVTEIWEKVRKDWQNLKGKVEKDAPGKLDVLQDLTNFQTLVLKLVKCT